MKENTLKIVINAPADKIFAFAINPENTGKWFAGIVEERANEWPVRLGTIYENRGANPDKWNRYTVSAFEENKVFELTGENYSVHYTFAPLGDLATEVVYREWVEEGELSDPTTIGPFDKLKELMEQK